MHPYPYLCLAVWFCCLDFAGCRSNLSKGGHAHNVDTCRSGCDYWTSCFLHLVSSSCCSSKEAWTCCCLFLWTDHVCDLCSVLLCFQPSWLGALPFVASWKFWCFRWLTHWCHCCHHLWKHPSMFLAWIWRKSISSHCNAPNQASGRASSCGTHSSKTHPWKMRSSAHGTTCC